MPSQADYVLDLSGADLDKLTHMLALPPQYGTAHPTRAWLSMQSDAIPTLSKAVLRPSKLLPRLAVRLTESVAAPRLPPAAVLCVTHKGLHPWLVRALFNLLAAEVTMRCDRLRGYEGKEGDGVGDVTARVVGILGSVNALWLEDEHFQLLFGEQSGPWGEKLRKVEGGCEACVLAAVGARGKLLAALRANLLGRTYGGEPRLLRVVESWMKWFGRVEAETMMRESDVMAKGVRRARRAVRREKREGRKGRRYERTGGERGSSRCSAESKRRSPSPQTPRHAERISPESPRLDGVGEGRESPVREEQIADWYARSEMELGSRVPARSIHPAFQPPSPCYEESETEEKASTHAGYTSVLDCYGTTASGGKTSMGAKSGMGRSSIGRKTGVGRKSSWVTCTVHTSQAPGHNPPPPEVPIPFLEDFGRDSVEVPIYACSSIYSGTASPTNAQTREWRGSPDVGTIFRSPFAFTEDGDVVRRESAQVSPKTVPEGGWI